MMSSIFLKALTVEIVSNVKVDIDSPICSEIKKKVLKYVI